MQAHVIRYTSLFTSLSLSAFNLSVSCRFLNIALLAAQCQEIFFLFFFLGSVLLPHYQMGKASFRFRPFSWLCQKSFGLSRFFSPAQIFLSWKGSAFFRPALKNTLPKGFQLVKENFSFFPLFLGAFFLRSPCRGRVTDSSVPVCLDFARINLACQEFFLFLFNCLEGNRGKP